MNIVNNIQYFNVRYISCSPLDGGELFSLAHDLVLFPFPEHNWTLDVRKPELVHNKICGLTDFYPWRKIPSPPTGQTSKLPL